MDNKTVKNKKSKKTKKSSIFLISLLNFLIIIFIAIYFIYLRFIPYKIITYDGYAVSGKNLINNLLNTSFEVDKSIDALEVKDQDKIYQNLKSYYVGASKEKDINLNYPIYINDSLALYNLSSKVTLITTDFQKIKGYDGFTLTSGALYNDITLERADYYDYIFMRNQDNVYINTKEMVVDTTSNTYTIGINSIINFTNEFITYYTLEDGKFVYGNILDLEEQSKIKIEDYAKEYTYKDVLLGLEIIKEEEKPIEEEKKEEEKKKENKENKEVNIVKEQNIATPNTENKNEDAEEPAPSNPVPAKWQKPVVSCKNFVANTYTATTEIDIKDPSGVISKAITFTFYIEDEISFRVSAISSGLLKVTKLMPDTTYRIVGTYQYTTESGGIIESTFLEQEMRTKGTKDIKAIELSLKNGDIYYDKIELKDLSIISNIEDEAIAGVSRADIEINGTIYPISTSILRDMLKGKSISDYSFEGLASNTKYNYKIRFYDTAQNEMKLKNNTGNTLTSKAKPSVSIKVKNQNIISLQLGITLSNIDKIELFNYRYVIYSDSGEIYKQSDLTIKTTAITLEGLNTSRTYTIKVYADYDIENGEGLLVNQEIGSANFTTLSLSQLGSIKLKLEYDNDQDLTYNHFKFDTKIDTTKTDERLIKILKRIEITIQDQEKKEEKSITITDINQLITGGVNTELNNLKSNTTYYIKIKSIASQGNEESEINTSYTLKSFITRKKPAKMYTKNLVVTDGLIDVDIMVDDLDGASLNNNFVIELRDSNEQLIDTKIIQANEYKNCTYYELKRNEIYTLNCYAQQYNETKDNRKTQTNYVIDTQKYLTKGLEGKLELSGLLRKNNNGVNLIDAESQNNWYSKCFDVLETEYNIDDYENRTFRLNSKNNYGKTYNVKDKTLTFVSGQCYVYDLKDYVGQEVTLSCKMRVSNVSIKDGVYLQEGKELGKKVEKIEGISTNWIDYEKTLEVPTDGYLGFYLSENSTQTLIVQNLQVQLGSEKTEYKDYNYNLKADIKINFLDENYVTFDGTGTEKYTKYYIKLSYNDKVEEYSYQELVSKIEKEQSFEIEEKESQTDYKIELIIKVNGREYVLNTISFTYNPDACKEIKSIKTIKEFLEIQPYGNYILLKDLDLTEANTISEYTFGNPNITFYGSIDFNGKTIKKDIYSNKIGQENTSYIFYNLASQAKLKNVVLDFYIDNIDKRYDIDKLDGIYGLFLYNQATIDNIMLNLRNCNSVDKRYVGLVGYENKNGGIINNFVINLDTKLYATQYISGICLYSSGTIQNGYMYGEGIEAIEDIVFYDFRNIGGLVYNLKSGGTIQNVYNLASIVINHIETTNSYAANIVYQADGNSNIRNVYSLQEFNVIYGRNSYEKLLDANNKEIDKGPNIYSSGANVQFSYYFCGTNYENNNINTKQDATVLNDYNYQENLLNANGYEAFNVEKNVRSGYYPHLKLNECMPLQERIAIELPSDNNIMDILTSELVNYETLDEEIKAECQGYDFNDENVHIAKFNIYNPSGRTITKVNIDYIETTVVYQSYNKKMSTVYAVLHNPTTCVDEYNISSVVGKNLTGNEKTVEYGTGGEVGIRTIKVSFTKYIHTAEEWDSIDSLDVNEVSGLIQNYKLMEDINFENSQYSPYINGVFTGRLDGQNHTLSNIVSDKYLFHTLSGQLQNLRINTYKQLTQENIAGLIRETRSGAFINNIHVKDEELNSSNTSSTTYIGGIVGYTAGGSVTVQNSSISGLVVSLSKQGSINNHAIGGIVGFSDNSLNITNCYTQDVDVSVNNINIWGIGGILGRETSTLTIKNCYSHGRIVTDQPYAGGIYGYTGNAASYINHNYSLINITGNMTSGNEYIGGIGGYHPNAANTTNNLYLGNIYVRKATTSNSRRIVGNQEGTTGYKNYGYKEQIINGTKSNTAFGATELLDYDSLFNIDTYISKLGFGQDEEIYKYSGLLENNILPQLYSTKGELLPNQKNHTIENGIKVMSTTYEYTENKDAVRITVTLENIDQLDITEFTIEDMTVEEKNQWSIKKEEIYTTITFIAKPDKYYDTYRLNNVKYTNKQGEEKELEALVKIATPFYKEISNADEWNEKVDTTSAENYRITGEIDFTDKTVEKLNASIGRLEADSEHTISNVTLTLNEQYSGFIKEIKTNLENINFSNFTIEGKTNNIGVIYQVNAPIKNCDFKNIKIDANGLDYVGIITRCNGNIENININKINVSRKKLYWSIHWICCFIRNI